jgi:hypothetical protein
MVTGLFPSFFDRHSEQVAPTDQLALVGPRFRLRSAQVRALLVVESEPSLLLR